MEKNNKETMAYQQRKMARDQYNSLSEEEKNKK